MGFQKPAPGPVSLSFTNSPRPRTPWGGAGTWSTREQTCPGHSSIAALVTAGTAMGMNRCYQAKKRRTQADKRWCWDRLVVKQAIFHHQVANLGQGRLVNGSDKSATWAALGCERV